jgi:hypothetical protein
MEQSSCQVRRDALPGDVVGRSSQSQISNESLSSPNDLDTFLKYNPVLVYLGDLMVYA